MRNQSWHAVIISAIIALLVIYVAWWIQMINNHSERNSTDFISFYAVGRIAQTAGYSSIYNIDLQHNMEEAVVGFPLIEGQVLLFIHPPQFVPLLALISTQDYVWSFIRWIFLLMTVYLGSIYFLVNSLYADQTCQTQLILAGGILTFFPLFISIWQGQDTAFLFLGLVLWAVGMLKKRDTPAALGLALIAIRPHICIALALPLILKKQTVLQRFVWIFGCLVLINLLVITPKGAADLLKLIQISAKGEWFGIRPEVMPNLIGMLTRASLVRDPSLVSTTGWIIYLVGVVAIAGLWIRSHEVDTRLLGLSVLVAIVTAPHLHSHDLTILIIPLLFAARRNEVGKFYPQPVLILLGVTFVFIAGSMIDALSFALVYLVYIALAWRLANKNGSIELEGIRPC